MSEQVDKPPMLYHGSAEKLARLESLNVIRIDPKRYAHWIRDRREAKPGST